MNMKFFSEFQYNDLYYGYTFEGGEYVACIRFARANGHSLTILILITQGISLSGLTKPLLHRKRLPLRTNSVQNEI